MSDEKIDLLIQIVSLGQKPALEELLSKSPGLNVNQHDEDGNIAAFIAAEHNDLDMLMILVKGGAKLDLKDGDGRTIMGWAQKHKNNEMIKYVDETLLNISKCFAKN